MADEYVKNCSTSLIFREMQINTIVKYCFIPTRMAINVKTDMNKFWRECGEREFLCTIDGMKISAAIMEKQYGVPQKLNIQLPYVPATPLLGIYLEIKH